MDKADAIHDLLLPWLDKPEVVAEHQHGLFLDRVDWPLIEDALNRAGWVVVPMEPVAAESSSGPAPQAPAAMAVAEVA